MAAFHFTRKAILDLEQIWEYTFEKWSEKQADFYYNLIIEDCSWLAKNPKKGKSYFEIQSDLFGKKSTRHIIFYRVIDESTIEITRILHEQMDLKNKHSK